MHVGSPKVKLISVFLHTCTRNIVYILQISNVMFPHGVVIQCYYESKLYLTLGRLSEAG